MKKVIDPLGFEAATPPASNSKFWGFFSRKKSIQQEIKPQNFNNNFIETTLETKRCVEEEDEIKRREILDNIYDSSKLRGFCLIPFFFYRKLEKLTINETFPKRCNIQLPKR